jgi:hypothetical protein
MTDLDDIPKRDWYYWLLIAFLAYASVSHLVKFLDNGPLWSLVFSFGAALFAIGLLSGGWPLRRKGEQIASMPKRRAVAVVISMIGAILLTAGGLWSVVIRLIAAR